MSLRCVIALWYLILWHGEQPSAGQSWRIPRIGTNERTRQRMGRKVKEERKERSQCRGVEEGCRQQQRVTQQWCHLMLALLTEIQISHLIFALILVPIASQLTQQAYWDTWHVDLPLFYSPLLSHTFLLSSCPLFRPWSAVSPTSVYVTAPLLVENKNAPQCVDKPSFKEIELYGDKRCPWAWVQITDWSDTADSLCFVN